MMHECTWSTPESVAKEGLFQNSDWFLKVKINFDESLEMFSK